MSYERCIHLCTSPTKDIFHTASLTAMRKLLCLPSFKYGVVREARRRFLSASLLSQENGGASEAKACLSRPREKSIIGQAAEAQLPGVNSAPTK